MALASFKLLKCVGAIASGSHASEVDCEKHPTFLTADTVDAVAANYPVAVPETGEDPVYSYETWLRMECTNAPDNYCQNFVVWGPQEQPDYPTDKLTIFIGSTSVASSAITTVSTFASHTAQQYYSVDQSTAWVPISADSITVSGVGSSTGYLILQLKVEAGASQGNMAGQSFDIEYEEL